MTGVNKGDQQQLDSYEAPWYEDPAQCDEATAAKFRRDDERDEDFDGDLAAKDLREQEAEEDDKRS